MTEPIPQRTRDILKYMRCALRRYRFHGGTLNPPREFAAAYEEAIAHAEYMLGFLDEDVASEVYGFRKVPQDHPVD